MRKFVKSGKMKAIALGLVSLLISGKTTAQDTVRLDLNQVLEIALSDNPTVRVAEQEIQLKKYVKSESIAGLFPNISASGTFSNALELQKMSVGFSPEPISLGQKYTIQGTFNLQLPLIAPQLWKSIQLNQQDVQLALEKSRASKIDMISQVKQAYFSMLLAKDAVDVLRAGYKTAELNAKNVTDKYEQGLVSEYEKLVADVQFRNQKPQVVNGENAVRLSIMQLKVLMGMDVNQPVDFTGNLKEYEAEMFSDLMHLKSDTSLENNSSLKQLSIQAKQLKTAEKINKMGYVPTLGLGLNYGWQSMNPDLKLKNYEWYPGSNLSLSLSIPIFDGGSKYFKTKQNKVSMLNLQLQRDNIERQLELSVTNSLNSIETAVEQVSSNKESVVQAEKAYTISQKRYAVGSGTLLEMNSSETALTQARLQYAQSIFDYLSARVTLEATLGKTINNAK